MRKNKKLIAILTTLVMLVALLVPMVGPAAAATTYSADKVLSVSANTVNTDGNRVVIKGTSTDALNVGDFVVLQLPADFKMRGSVIVPPTIGADPNDVFAVSVDGSPAGNNIPFGVINRVNQIKIEVAAVHPGVWTPYIYVKIDELEVPGGATGEVKLTAEASSGSGFTSGQVTIAQVGVGQVTLGLEKVALITSAGGPIDTLKIKETLAGNLEVSNESLKFKLPNGFTWADPVGTAKIERVWPACKYPDGTNVPANIPYPPGTVWGTPTRSDGDRTINFDVYTASTSATYLQVSGLRVNVDESVAKYGDVEVTISGKSSVTPTSAVIAKYGDYKVTVSKVEAEAVQPGIREEKIGKFAIEEAVPSTIIKDRTITLTLPDKAKWDGEYPTISAGDSTLLGFNIGGFTAVGTDGRMIKATVSSASTGDKPTKIVFKGGKITVAADYVGDIALEVGGSAGVSGSVVVAEAKAPITATASAKPEVKIGLPDQVAADITITEVAKEILESLSATKDVSSQVYNGYLTIKAPPGVRFTTTPKFEVTEGDVSLGTVVKTGDDQIIEVRVKATSSKPSTIKISGVKLVVDRTVPEGDVTLKIGGTSLVQNNYEPFFPDVSWATKLVVATCITPHPEDLKRVVVFTIGDTKYKIGDMEETMDVAPYIKNGRTYLPVRYVAYALGVSPSNILWDNTNGTVTLIKGDRVIQVQIKNKVMLINGAKITMDVAPEIKDGRTMLPFRWIAQALGASVQWDEATKTVTMKL